MRDAMRCNVFVVNMNGFFNFPVNQVGRTIPMQYAHIQFSSLLYSLYYMWHDNLCNSISFREFTSVIRSDKEPLLVSGCYNFIAPLEVIARDGLKIFLSIWFDPVIE